MSPVPDRPTSTDLSVSPVETDKNVYGYGDYEPDKIDYGYGDDEPENRNSPRSTRVVPSIKLPHVPKEKAHRRGSAFGRLQILPEDDNTDLERVGFYDDKTDEDEDVRFINKIARMTPSDPRRAKVRRRGSAFGRRQDDAALSSSFSAELNHKSVVYGDEEADAIAKLVYGYEDADANREMAFTPRPEEANARRRGSALDRLQALGRLQEDSTIASSTQSGSQELDKSDYGYEDADAGSQEVDKSYYGYGYEDADIGSQEVGKADYDYGYEDEDEDVDTESQDMIDKAVYVFQQADTNRNLTNTHSSRAIKARRRGSALGRLQEDSTLSSTKMAIPDAAPCRQKSQRRTSVGEANSKWSSPNVAIPNAEPPRRPSRDRTSIGAIDAPFGILQEQSSMSQGSTAPAPIRRGSRRRTSVGASDAPLDDPQDCTRHNSRTQASITRAKSRRRMSVGATSLTAKVIPVEPNVSATSRQDESKERDSCDGLIRQRAPGRHNRGGSACGRLQSGWDVQAPDMEALDRILLAQEKMGLVDPSKAPLGSSKSLRRVNEYSIPW
jgi:hypothetical protein